MGLALLVAVIKICFSVISIKWSRNWILLTSTVLRYSSPILIKKNWTLFPVANAISSRKVQQVLEGRVSPFLRGTHLLNIIVMNTQVRFISFEAYVCFVWPHQHSCLRFPKQTIKRIFKKTHSFALQGKETYPIVLLGQFELVLI